MNIYFIRRNGDPRGLVKIGFAGDLAARLQSLACAVPEGLEVLATMPGTLPQERALHKKLREHRVAGEWFLPHPEVMAVVEEAKSDQREVGAVVKEAREAGADVPHYTTLTNENSVVEVAISCLNELVRREMQGQGDTQTGARVRVAERIGVPATLLRRLWSRWRSMNDVPASLLIAVSSPVADMAEAEGNLPSGLELWTTAKRAWMDEHMRRDAGRVFLYVRDEDGKSVLDLENPRFPERDTDEDAT